MEGGGKRQRLKIYRSVNSGCTHYTKARLRTPILHRTLCWTHPCNLNHALWIGLESSITNSYHDSSGAINLLHIHSPCHTSTNLIEYRNVGVSIVRWWSSPHQIITNDLINASNCSLPRIFAPRSLPKPSLRHRSSIFCRSIWEGCISRLSKSANQQ